MAIIKKDITQKDEIDNTEMLLELLKVKHETQVYTFDGGYETDNKARVCCNIIFTLDSNEYSKIRDNFLDRMISKGK